MGNEKWLAEMWIINIYLSLSPWAEDVENFKWIIPLNPHKQFSQVEYLSYQRSVLNYPQ